MISEAVLRLGVERAIINADQASALRALAKAEAEREFEPSEDREKLRFISGFGDIFVVIGIALFLERRAAPVSDGADAPASPGFGKAAALLLAGNMRRDTLAIWAAYFWSMMAVYLSLNWLPSLLAGEGFDLRGASLVAAIFNCGGIVGALLGAALIRPFGSKIVLVAMALGGGATSALLVAWPPHPGAFAPTLALLALLGVFSAGIQSILFAVAAQLYAVETRATAIGVAVGFGRTGAMISAIAGGALIGVEGGGFFVIIALLMTMLAISLTILRKHVSRHHDAA